MENCKYYHNQSSIPRGRVSELILIKETMCEKYQIKIYACFLKNKN